VVGPGRNPTSWEHLPQARAAAGYAERKHAGHCRSDGTPFIQHPLEVAMLLYFGGAADHVIAAGLLHDVIEKAGVSVSDVRLRFGPRITGLVLAVSDDDSIPDYGRRKAALRHQVAAAGGEALEVFAADKLSKLRELRREVIGSPGRGIRGRRGRRLRHYQRSLALLEERLPESPLVHDLRAELESFLREPAMLVAAG
jgi:hypothetical protein